MAWRSRGARLLAAALTALVGLAVVQAPARAASSSNFIPVAETSVYDTRTIGGPLAAGIERRIDLTGLVAATVTSVAVRITTFDSPGYGDVSVHACGAHDAAGPTDIPADLDQVSANVVIVALQASSFCLTSTVKVDLAITVVGIVDTALVGDGYVATASSVVFDATVPVGQVLTVPLPTVPANATGVTLELDGQAADLSRVFIGACTAPRPPVPTMTIAGGSRAANTFTEIASRQFCLQTTEADAHVVVTLTGYWATGAVATADGPPRWRYRRVRGPGLVAVTPVRLFDTRDATAVAGGSVYQLDLSSRVPVDTTSAVVMNVTVTDPVSAGFVTVYPCDAPQPTASNLNYVARQTVPNLVTVAISATGTVCFYSQSTTHLVADLSGYYEIGGGAGLVPNAPTRLFDTRDRNARVDTGGVYELDLTGKVPADATAAVMNVTVTDPVLAGFVTVYPCSSPRPTASNVNYVARQTVPNLVTVALAPDKRVCFYAHAATHLLADLAASYAPSSKIGFYAPPPFRRFDTRGDGRPIASGAAFPFSFGPGVIDGVDQVSAVVLNITSVEAQAAGYVTAYACDGVRPTASNVNYVANDVVPNLAIVATGATDQLCFYSQSTTHLVVDEAGYFSEAVQLRQEVTR